MRDFHGLVHTIAGPLAEEGGGTPWAESTIPSMTRRRPPEGHWLRGWAARGRSASQRPTSSAGVGGARDRKASAPGARLGVTGRVFLKAEGIVINKELASSLPPQRADPRPSLI